jgi:hypothetical protein
MQDVRAKIGFAGDRTGHFPAVISRPARCDIYLTIIEWDWAWYKELSQAEVCLINEAEG